MEPINAKLRIKTSENWTPKNQHVMKKLVVEGGWAQQRLYDTEWSDEKIFQGCKEEEVRRSTDSSTVMEGTQIAEELGKWEQRAKTSRKYWKW